MQDGRHPRMLVAIDGSPAADRAVSFAIALATMTGGELLFCWVVEPGYPEGLEAARSIAETALYVAVEKAKAHAANAHSRLLLGSAPKQIVRELEEIGADLLVVGMRTRSEFEQMMLGSVSQELLRVSPVPVLIVREDMNVVLTY
jgi:nucleotide-binding universal stress UspA family protein